MSFLHNFFLSLRQVQLPGMQDDFAPHVFLLNYARLRSYGKKPPTPNTKRENGSECFRAQQSYLHHIQQLVQETPVGSTKLAACWSNHPSGRPDAEAVIHETKLPSPHEQMSSRDFTPTAHADRSTSTPQFGSLPLTVED